MDVASLASAFVAGQTAQIQLAVAAAMMRANMQAEVSAVEVIAAAQENVQSMANLASGVGQNLNVVA